MKWKSGLWLAGSVIVLFSGAAPADELYLTLEDGVAVVLHTNHTWRYQKPGDATSMIGKPIDLDDGSTLVLQKNGTWGFVTDKTGRPGAPSSGLQSLNSVGVAKRSDLGDARAEAMKTALERLAKQFRSAMPKLVVEERVLMECIESEEKDVETSDEWVDMYKATVKLNVDEMGIRNILHCIESRRRISEEVQRSE